MKDPNCYHCGLPNDDEHTYSTQILGEQRFLCCPGCLAVSEAIVQNGLEDYYQFRTEPAIKSDDVVPAQLSKLTLFDEPALQEDFVVDEGNNKSIQLTVEGITCAACGWLIEKQLSKVTGIAQVSVNVQERRAMVAWADDQLKLSQILKALKRIGYKGAPFQPDDHEASYKREEKSFLKKLGLAGIMTMQVMMLMAGLYFDWFGAIEAETRDYFYWVALTLTTPVVLYSGSLFYIGAAKALLARTVNMDVPITLAVFGTYIAGLKSTLLQEGEVYFESICMFIFLLLLSRFLEHRSRHRAAQISANMTQYVPVSATKIDEHGNLVQCLAKQLQKDELTLIKPGETIPVDGVVLEGSSSVDESMLTGEFNPVLKETGSLVYGGTVSKDGSLTIKVTNTLKHALVNQIVRLQTTAMANKPKVAQIADEFSRIFVVAVLLISSATYLYWYLHGSENAFWITVSVLVATCPCALGLATPSALTCAMAKLNKHGILLKRADAIEQLTKINTIALDKTGTLTQGKFSIQALWVNSNHAEQAVLDIAACLESRSEHPIAKAFDTKSSDLVMQGFEVTPGGGVSGEIQGTRYQLGSKHFCFGEKPLPSLEFEANVFLVTDRELLGAFKVTDTLRKDAKDSLTQLKDYKLAMFSGDMQHNVDSVAKSLSINIAKGELSPEQKFAEVKALQEQGDSVLMMGDGINDAPVLASADVAIAVGNATDVAKTAADVILLGDKLSVVPFLLKSAQRAKATIRQNMAWAVGYNLVILPFAVSGMLSPWMAVVGMSLSSIIVVYNSTRLLRG
ncbi:heavy metal translocating P-type ATPase [Alteromonas sp. KUL49]|uniref:heavy metal translocating P-type ATPase n=1 Tax=Alteromonas sp. KUL49 TaxID=2480798 RepID=UPI00102F0AA5|nr:heavy metal translocating P-type ATPase [Alteromonas sp. KUL49]TAP40815.1 cadmium-translocating P-type ATPase [Alteromonas sp. KUL49]GEA10992.1 copper-translocating P-type ATPase [Alteromonas sp. KUL49]